MEPTRWPRPARTGLTRDARHHAPRSFCGGDFLYDFPAEFARARVLVFTAGLLMRLTKLGVYSLAQASLLVLHDAFSSVRNHPMNTLVREYYWKLPGGDAARPKVSLRSLCTVGPHSSALPLGAAAGSCRAPARRALPWSDARSARKSI